MKIDTLDGKLVLVTGAASGIGHATAIAFARAGARLVVTDLDAARLDPLVRELEALGAKPMAEVVDVASEADMLRVAEAVVAQAGIPHVLINNAGLGYLGRFLDTPMTAWRRVLDVNVLGVVNGCRAFLPHMQSAEGPRRIVNVASAAAFAPTLNMSAYAASKYAVMGLCDVLHLELHGSQVGVTAVCPGIIDTAIVANRKGVADSISEAQLERIQRYYRQNGATADVVAREIVRGVQAGRALVLVGPKARPSYHAKRLSRSLTARLSRAESKAIGFA